ncbi:MAG: radical SAM protein [Anaerolineaceae bacterium]|nr:radical SAM protein [Anaerolineaceae bacterium]
MIVREIEARTLLSSIRPPDPTFGLRYNFNLYRGCQHQCIYCDSRSECYQIEDFAHEILVKSNAIALLDQELARKRQRGTIGTGSMNDPYMPCEAHIQLTRRALQVILKHRFPVHVITKSNLVRRDADILEEIAKVYAAVSFTITTADDALGRKLEPGAPPVSERLAAIRELSGRGIYCGVTLMPVLPFLTDNEENLTAIVRLAAEAGASYILPGFGVTLRDRQRAYFYQQLERLFPGLSARYEAAFGQRYHCAPRRPGPLEERFRQLCQEYGLATHMAVYRPDGARQLSLF